MTELSVVPLVPQDQQDQEKIGKVIEHLQQAHAKGEVYSLLYLFYNAKTEAGVFVSPNMRTSHLALAIQYLQLELQKYLAARTDRSPPETIA